MHILFLSIYFHVYLKKTLMEIRHLLLVKNIVELGSLAKSKDKLCLTQSALSHQLKEAESQAGTALFIRSNKKLILTSAGEIAYKTAIDVLTKIDHLNSEMQQIAKGNKGIIRICTACFTNYYWLPGLIAKFSQLHPNVEIKVIPEYINETLSRLKNHDLDAVIMNKPENEKGIQYVEILNDELFALVSPAHKWTKKKYVTATDFIDENLIIFSKPMDTVVVYNKVLKPKGIMPKHVYEVPMSEAIADMVASGMGVAVIPHWIAKPYIESGKVIPVKVTRNGLHRSLGIAFLEKPKYPAYYNTLIEFLTENIISKGLQKHS
jgi:LysR family transcriptional regulator for metE and metH